MHELKGCNMIDVRYELLALSTRDWFARCFDRRSQRASVASLLAASLSLLPMKTSFADEQADQSLQEVVVTAQKREERLQDVPISITVLSGAALDTSTSQSLFDQLNRVPGVVIPPQGGNSALGVTQIAIRGVASSGLQWSGSSPIAYYLDGVPFGFVRSAFIPDSNAFDLARVEVLRGPQGTLYGASAEDGVVRIIPNAADFSGFDLKARVLGSGTDGGGVNSGGDIAVNVPLLPGQLAVRGVFGYEDWSGWIDRPEDKNANDAQLRNFRLNLAYQPIDGLSIALSYWGSRDHYGSQPNSLPDRSAPYGEAPQPIDNNFDSFSARISYQFSHVLITSTTSYLEFNGYNAWDGTYLFSVPLILANWLDSHVFSEELLLNSVDTGPWHWTAGAFYRNAGDTNSQGAGIGMAPTSPDPSELAYVDFKDSSRSYAVFGEVGRRFWDNKFEWTLGLRQFHDNVASTSLDPQTSSYVPESFSATTPRGVLSWYPNTNITVYSSFSEGFRSGLPQYYTVTSILPSVPPARPDKLYNYEVGTKGDFFDHRLTVDVAGYYVDWKDVQQTIGVPIDVGNQVGFLNAVLNGPSASGPGLDIGITTRPIDRLRLGATFSWNDLTMNGPVEVSGLPLFNKGDRLNNSSEYTGSLFGSFTVPLGGDVSGELSANANYLGKQATHAISGSNLPYVNYGNNLIFLQAAFTVRFRKNWSAKLYGDNLTNEYGSVVGPPVGFDPTMQDQGVPRPRPRTIGLEVDYGLR